ncbi:hypothetical protein Taro_044422 [Colocasia esculenta]|uniref:Uncharacterized protein n=1 Tax=Colocasia esculenta TaxID=4460 RepID=A0A843X2P0_COLES|nr:hypothetical protein [Colocasia esculenta]
MSSRSLLLSRWSLQNLLRWAFSISRRLRRSPPSSASPASDLCHPILVALTSSASPSPLIRRGASPFTTAPVPHCGHRRLVACSGFQAEQSRASELLVTAPVVTFYLRDEGGGLRDRAVVGLQSRSKVINESADKSFPIVEVACQGGKDISMDRADISKRSYSPDKLGRPFEPNSMRGGENRTILQQEAADENLPHHTMPRSVTIGDYCSEIAIKRRKVFLTQNENEEKPQDVEVKPSEYMETSFSSQEVTWQG